MNFDNSYANLPEYFYTKINPDKVKLPELIVFNNELARDLGLPINDLSENDLVQILSGNEIISQMQPIAQVYAGHQFGGFTILGDGRAHLLGEIITPKNRRFDMQLKGSGHTPYSRNGDGRATLASMLREYIISEAMFALGVPTTRSLAVVASGEIVYRERGLPGAVLTRIASSHIRVGTFEYFAAKNNISALQTLAKYTIDRHYPEINNSESIYLQLFEKVGERQAKLIAHWMRVGFVHGVMNTDNVSIAGESMDYGPCAFIDEFHPDKLFSSIDRNARYCFSNQPQIAMWNLARFAETLIILVCQDGVNQKDAVSSFEQIITNTFDNVKSLILAGKAEKILINNNQDKNSEEAKLIILWLALLQKHQADFTNAHRALTDYASLIYQNPDIKFTDIDTIDTFHKGEKELFSKPDFQTFLTRWQKIFCGVGGYSKQNQEKLINKANTVNPYYIPRNHRVEEVIRAAEYENDFAPLHKLINVLASPYNSPSKLNNHEYCNPPKAEDVVRATFCGT